MSKIFTYADGVREGFDFILKKYKDSLVMGQGVWSPWYVGSTMKNLDKKYGKE